MRRTVVITGAAGNLGSKLREHLEGRYDLRLLDVDDRGDSQVQQCDMADWDPAWTKSFVGADAVVHLAADPVAHRTWPELVRPNIDALCNAYEAAAQGGVRRFVYASSNHVMGGYQHRTESPLTADLPPRPGTRYQNEGMPRDSEPYAAAKLFGERLGRTYALSRGMQVVAVRIGWVFRDANRPKDLPIERGHWFAKMWLSNRDFCRLMECCLTAELQEPYLLVNGMSNNRDMRWDLEPVRRLLGYEPQDDVERPS